MSERRAAGSNPDDGSSRSRREGSRARTAARDTDLCSPQDNVHGGLSNRDRDELQRAMFAARSVEPRASRQGFLFFDVSGLDNPAQGARLYATGITDARGHELMYFEVALGPVEEVSSPPESSGP